MQRSVSVVVLLAALVSCRDYDLHSRLTDQGGLVPADQFARYGREQAEGMAIAREFGAASKRSSPEDLAKQAEAASTYARKLPDMADVQADPLGYRLTLQFKSGWRTMVTPVEDGKRGAETVGVPGSGTTVAQ
jgi:crotonobetainyl-CoA:carnitine CoA-transferase CaiB-like acyl-CoA transferase